MGIRWALQFEIWKFRGGNEEVVNLFDQLVPKFRDSLGGVKLAGTEGQSLFPLAIGGRKRHDGRSQLLGELNRQMTQPTDTNDSDPVTRDDGTAARRHEGTPDGGSSTQQGTSKTRIETVGENVKASGRENNMRAVAALVVVCRSELLTLEAVLIGAWCIKIKD